MKSSLTIGFRTPWLGRAFLAVALFPGDVFGIDYPMPVCRLLAAAAWFLMWPVSGVDEIDE